MWGLARPIFNLTRLVIVLAIASVLVLFVANALVAALFKRQVRQPAQRPPARVETRQGVPDVQRTPPSRETVPPESDPPPKQPERVAPTQVALPEVANPESATPVSDTQPVAEPSARPPDNSGRGLDKDRTAVKKSHGTIRSLAIDGAGDALVLEILTTVPPDDYYVFEIPNRLVLDLKGKWSSAPGMRRQLKVNHPLVEGIRTGTHPDFFRFVFDLRQGAAVEPRIEVKGDGLVCIVARSK